MDLRASGAREVLRRLIEPADVFATSYLPGVRRRLGVDVEDIRAMNPKIVICSVGEKPVSPAPSSSTSLRSARMVLGFQPNSARSARVSQPSPLSRATSLGRGTTMGRLGVGTAAGSLGLTAASNEIAATFFG